MNLKHYQRRVVDEVERYLVALAAERAKGNTDFGSQAAWKRCGLGKYEPRENGVGEDLPTFCIKVPTGGGKTLLATQALGSIYRTILRHCNGAGLALWVVPSTQIYRDTLRRLRDRTDMYRQMLEHAVSRRIELWEKHEISRLSPTRLRDCLNILIIKLASANREDREILRVFRDSGGAIVEHFPPEDDLDAHRKLRSQVPNLDVLKGADGAETDLLATSVGNLVRICKPPVILDEGHKAYSARARSTIETFNPSIVVELSATPPKEANIVTRVSGQQLLDEEMIKLPLNIATSGQKNWKDVLTQARDKRLALEQIAAEFAIGKGRAGESRMIRPMVLVQVERTGKDQRAAKFIHSEQVKEYLIQKLSVPGAAIAIKSAASDDIEGIDLMDPGCPIQWIITKSALQEGWDCPFAYILVSLCATKSGRAMTQLVGRVLRQPDQQRTAFPELNESYIYCLHQRAGEIARQVKSALEKEGYEGEAASAVVDASGKGHERAERTTSIRKEFAALYGEGGKKFEGKIYLPRFCVKENGKDAPLDYYRHLIAHVDVSRLEYDKIDWPLADALKDAKDRFYRVSLGTELQRQFETDTDLVETDEQVLAWMVASLKFEFLSHKQLRVIVRKVYERLCAAELQLAGRLGLVKFVVRDHVERFIQDQLDKQTEKAFGDLFDAGKIRFYLQCAECRFEIPSSIKIESKGKIEPLTHNDGQVVAKSLFDFAESERVNEYERSVALVMDRHADVLWWYRNRVGPENFSVQGYRRHRIYPDFVVQGGTLKEPKHSVVVVETKGKHLEGNPDTTYKRRVAHFFDRAGKTVTWQKLGDEFKDHVFRFQILDEAQPHGRDWQDELRDLLAGV